MNSLRSYRWLRCWACSSRSPRQDAGSRDKEEVMPTPALRMLWRVLAVVGAAFLVISGLFGNWGAGAESPTWQRWPIVLVGVLMIVGVLVRNRAPVLALSLVAVGAIVVALKWWVMGWLVAALLIAITVVELATRGQSIART
jgi:hypothetical protein